MWQGARGQQGTAEGFSIALRAMSDAFCLSKMHIAPHLAEMGKWLRENLLRKLMA
jgi:hypothetical protein